jgi:hypothetical protein
MGMPGLSSPRTRRRLVWGGGTALAATLLIGGGLMIGDTAEHHDIRPTGNRPAMIITTPKTVRATPDERVAAYEVAIQFINTAVRRKHVDLAYDLVTPNMRSGMTRSAWKSGEIPVMPFPADSPRLSRWRIDFQQRDALGLIFLLMPEQKRRDYQPTSFFLDLKATGHGKKRRWRVDYFAPASVAVTPNDAPAGGPSGFNVNPQASGEPRLGRGELGSLWLIVPLAVLGLAIMVPSAFAIRGWVLGRRARRDYERALDV